MPGLVPHEVDLLPCPFCGNDVTIVERDKLFVFRCPDHSFCIGSGMATYAKVDQRDTAIAAWNTRLAAPTAAHYAALEEVLRWALPLAERSMDDHRLERLRCGHGDITGTDKNGVKWAGIYQSEVDQIERARAALEPSK